MEVATVLPAGGDEEISEQDAPDVPNRGSLDASRKGKAAELLLAASCILASGGELNVSMSFVNDEGVDLVAHRRGRPTTLALQVKSRFTSAPMTQGGSFSHDVRGQTFAPRPDFHLLFLVVDDRRPAIEMAWLVPSEVFAKRAHFDGHNRWRFTASMRETSQDRWRQFRLSNTELPGQLLSVLAELDQIGR